MPACSKNYTHIYGVTKTTLWKQFSAGEMIAWSRSGLGAEYPLSLRLQNDTVARWQHCSREVAQHPAVTRKQKWSFIMDKSGLHRDFLLEVCCKITTELHTALRRAAALASSTVASRWQSGLAVVDCWCRLGGDV